MQLPTHRSIWSLRIVIHKKSRANYENMIKQQNRSNKLNEYNFRMEKPCQIKVTLNVFDTANTLKLA